MNENEQDNNVVVEDEVNDETLDNENQDDSTQTTNNNTTKKQENKSFVKIREDKAREKLLKELGVKSIDEAKQKLANADTALSKIEAIEKKLQAQETEQLNSKKVKVLTELLDNEKVFDADALINYIDLDKVELDSTGKISTEDSKSIIASLKKLKPNYFGKEFIKSDAFSKSNTSTTTNPETDYQTDYEAGNYQAVIAKFLKNNKK